MLKSLQARLNSAWTVNFQMFKLDLEKEGNQRSNCQLLLDHQKSEGVPEKHLFLLYWLCQSLWLSSVQLLSCVRLFVTPWTTAWQASLSITNSQSIPKLMSIESVMPSNHFILCRALLLLPSIFRSIRVSSNESALHISWPKYWSFSISPSNEHSGLISFRMDWLDLLAVQGAQESSLTP